MKFKVLITAALAVALSCGQANAQATILPPPETCFQATTGIAGMVGALGSITGGSLYTAGSYGGISLTGGTGSGATANVVVSGGAVTSVSILNPGVGYVVGDVISAAAASIGGTGSGFSVPVNSVAINSAVAGGSIGFYIPSTLSSKQTWANSGQTVLNQNPVPLDANGCAIVYGSGVYRAILKDSLGNTIYDQLTASTNGSNGIFWASLAHGTGNAITVVDTAFANQDGYNLQFLASHTNAGPTTISVSGGTPIAIVKDAPSGPAALSGSEIGIGNTPMLTYDATAAEFHLVNPATGSSSATSSSLTPPQGYLNLAGAVSGSVVQTGDISGVSTVFYSPFVGNQIPIWNGTNFIIFTFSELTTTLTASGSPASSVQDNCVFSNNGVPTLVTGPSWTSTTNRGSGAGTPQITRLNGLWVNAVSIIGYNGLSSFTIPANQCTYVGSVNIDTSAGQVSAFRTVGQNRKFGVWNAYNRQNIVLQLQDPSTSWVDGGGNRWIGSNTGSTSDVITVFTGLQEEEVLSDFGENATFGPITGASVAAAISIGINGSTTPAAQCSIGAMTLNPGSASSFVLGESLKAKCTLNPFLGVINLFSIENPSFGAASTTNVTYQGGQQMLMTAQYRG